MLNIHSSHLSRADDEGHVGAHANDTVLLKNSHPHQQHSTGYHVQSPHHTATENHGFEGVHISHDSRDKNPEHHPPKGLMAHGVKDSGAGTPAEPPGHLS